MTLTLKYDVPIDDYYYIPAGKEVEFCGYENGFVVIQYNQMQYMMNEGYFDKIGALTG